MKKPKLRQKKSKRTAILSCLTRTKSITVSTKLSIAQPVYRVYAQFCQETTLHGLKHTVEKKLHWLERIVWFVLTVCAFAGAVYCALSQWYRYNSEPVVVSLQRDYRSWWTTFPAVTACFLDRVQPEKAREVIGSTWNVSEETDPDKYQYYYDFIELVSDVSFRDNLQNFWKYQADESVKGISLLELALAVHPNWTLDVVVSQKDHQVIRMNPTSVPSGTVVEWERRYHVEQFLRALPVEQTVQHAEGPKVSRLLQRFQPVNWHPVMTEVGMCLSFNSVYAEYQHMRQDIDWKPQSLLQCHYHSGQCFVRVDSKSSAVRYFIHSPYEISTAISNPTGEVLPGEELVIDYKVVEIQASPSVKNLRTEQRRCKYPDEWISDSIRAYSFSLCQMNCRSRMAAMFCGCRPYFHVKGASLGGTTALFVGASVFTVVETAFFIVRNILQALQLILRRQHNIKTVRFNT